MPGPVSWRLSTQDPSCASLQRQQRTAERSRGLHWTMLSFFFLPPFHCEEIRSEPNSYRQPLSGRFSQGEKPVKYSRSLRSKPIIGQRQVAVALPSSDASNQSVLSRRSCICAEKKSIRPHAELSSNCFFSPPKLSLSRTGFFFLFFFFWGCSTGLSVSCWCTHTGREEHYVCCEVRAYWWRYNQQSRSGGRHGLWVSVIGCTSPLIIRLHTTRWVCWGRW